MLVIQRPTVEAIDDEVDNRQRFAISPLEPGFGHTLGNSLRRTLLSSIPGAAITTARFDDSLHEFDTVVGVAEDLTDIILNLKDIVVTSVSDEAVTMRLDARGAGAVTAPAVLIGEATSRSTPKRGCVTSRIISRWRTCSSMAISRTCCCSAASSRGPWRTASRSAGVSCSASPWSWEHRHE
mgnify:CR=1 FL=1